ncbi:hypothetical protein Droror1_Dr00013669 [Drosera rotundifolia]
MRLLRRHLPSQTTLTPLSFQHSYFDRHLPSQTTLIVSAPDDSMAILMAFQTPEVEIIGFTTIFGNCEIGGYPDVLVAEGSPGPLKGGIPCVADFIHGSDGLGHINLPPPRAKKIDKSAAEFLVEKISEYPGEVSILVLGPLTNLALVSAYH